MMNSQNAAAQYRAVRSHGLVADATPARLVQIMFEHILAHLAAAQGCMGRIHGNLPLKEITAKCAAMGKAVRLIAQLDGTLDMERGGEIARNLRDLYVYMLNRLTAANVTNDAAIVAEVSQLVRKIKSGWDSIVRDGQ
jgi:flagellar protein FliS